MSVENKKGEFGVLPYSDGSGNRFEVFADENKGNPRIIIRKFSDSEVWVQVDEWPYLKEAVERALAFLNPRSKESSHG